MVVSCWVHGCSNRADKHVQRSFYYVPKVRVHEGDQTHKLSTERRRVWLKNIGRTQTPTMASRICSDHFVSGKPSALYDRGNVDWAPTLKLIDTRPKKMKRAKTSERNKTADNHCGKIETEEVDAARALLALAGSSQNYTVEQAAVDSESKMNNQHKYTSILKILKNMQ